MKKTTQKQIFSLFLIVAFVGSTITFAILNTTNTQEEEDIWVVRVSVVIFGDLQTIPEDLKGEKIFTIAADNLIYKNVEGNVMLREVFDMWGENFNQTCIMNYCNIANNSMRMYVNDKENFDYDLYTIKKQDNIVIDYR